MVLDDLIENVKNIEAPRLLKPVLTILLQRVKELEERIEKIEEDVHYMEIHYHKDGTSHIGCKLCDKKCNHEMNLIKGLDGEFFYGCIKCGEKQEKIYNEMP